MRRHAASNSGGILSTNPLNILNFNVIFLGLLIYLTKYKDIKDMTHLVAKFFPETGDGELDRDRDNDIFEEIEE